MHGCGCRYVRTPLTGVSVDSSQSAGLQQYATHLALVRGGVPPILRVIGPFQVHTCFEVVRSVYNTSHVSCMVCCVSAALALSEVEGMDIIGCTFNNNTAYEGGAIYSKRSIGRVSINNTVFAYNAVSYFDWNGSTGAWQGGVDALLS